MLRSIITLVVALFSLTTKLHTCFATGPITVHIDDRGETRVYNWDKTENGRAVLGRRQLVFEYTRPLNELKLITDSSVARSLMNINGVWGFEAGYYRVTIHKGPYASWDNLEPKILEVIENAFQHESPVEYAPETTTGVAAILNSGNSSNTNSFGIELYKPNIYPKDLDNESSRPILP